VVEAAEVTPHPARDGWWERLSRSTFSPWGEGKMFFLAAAARRTHGRAPARPQNMIFPLRGRLFQNPVGRVEDRMLREGA